MENGDDSKSNFRAKVDDKAALNEDSEMDEVIRETMREQDNDNELALPRNQDRSLFSYGQSTKGAGKVKKSLILPKLIQENKRINYENIKMLKRILSQPPSTNIDSRKQKLDYFKHR